MRKLQIEYHEIYVLNVILILKIKQKHVKKSIHTNATCFFSRRSRKTLTTREWLDGVCDEYVKRLMQGFCRGPSTTLPPYGVL